jgi:hypothetical protein
MVIHSDNLVVFNRPLRAIPRYILVVPFLRAAGGLGRPLFLMRKGGFAPL